jgi:hypothetical protein
MMPFLIVLAFVWWISTWSVQALLVLIVVILLMGVMAVVAGPEGG